jgi:molybdopterin adenylyltransferase
LLSRGAAGVRGRALVVNLPGSPGACRDGFEVLRPALAHAVSLLADEPTAHRPT